MGKSRYFFIGAIAFTMVCVTFYHFSEIASNSKNDYEPTKPPQLTAAIVDHLSISQPNQTFINQSTNALKNAGFKVDYYSGEEVTVNFYKHLPTHDYRLIILRVHSAIVENTRLVALFTSELYDEYKAATTYFWDAFDDRIVSVFFTDRTPQYFGITPRFIKSTMKEKFQDTIILMMGCDGLRIGYTSLAQAFLEKGAKVYVGWSGLVTSAHSDATMIHLLRALIIQKQTIINAIIDTMNDVGPDPTLGSELLLLPMEQRNYTLQKNTDI